VFACLQQWLARRILYVDQRVRISVEDSTIVIRPVEDAELTLDQRLARFDQARHGGEVMTGSACWG